MPAVPAFGELPIAVGFKAADFCVFILGSWGIFHKIGKSPFPMPAQGFSKDEPALGLGENPGVFFCPRIVNDSQCAVKGMCMLGRIHQKRAVFRVQFPIDIGKYGVCLCRFCKPADHGPALGVQPQVSFWVC